MAEDIKKKVGLQRKRSYLARDFQGFRADLLEHARAHFSDKIQDFSESSMGGLFLDMAAYVGDNMSFYLDHQFRELSPETVTEGKNLEAMIKNAGLRITGNAPASVYVEFDIEVATEPDQITGKSIPKHSELPVILENARLKADNGTVFYLTHDLDFSLQDENGEYEAEVTPITDGQGTITSFVLTLRGLCVSGTVKTETFDIGSTFVPFRTITLSEPHISSILRVVDADGNEYFEVESLSQDTVFRKNLLSSGDYSIDVIPSPYRFTSQMETLGRLTTIQFGSSNSEDETQLSDPSMMALPLYGKQAFSAFSLDPNSLMTNRSLGVSPTNTTIEVTYRYGGGPTHNVPASSINEILEIDWRFATGILYDRAQSIKRSASVENPLPSAGGAAAPTTEELRAFITSSRTMQNRIVTTSDLLARIYTMPTEFGVVYRANILPNPENSLASLLYIICRDSNGRLTIASDALKRNLSTYLNEFRLIGDAIDILDGRVINFEVTIDVKLSPAVNKYEVMTTIMNRVAELFPKEKVNLGKEIVISEITTTVSNVQGVLSVPPNGIQISNIFGSHDNRDYSRERLNFSLIEKDGILQPKPYEIFELRYPNDNIHVNVL